MIFNVRVLSDSYKDRDPVCLKKKREENVKHVTVSTFATLGKFLSSQMSTIVDASIIAVGAHFLRQAWQVTPYLNKIGYLYLAVLQAKLLADRKELNIITTGQLN